MSAVATTTRPPPHTRLTARDIPGHALCAIAVEMVMDQLTGRREPETRLLAPKLTERDSCGSPPASRDTTRRS
jgi:DNA-binding LacI/PurR family transcriptional regulator